MLVLSFNYECFKSVEKREEENHEMKAKLNLFGQHSKCCVVENWHCISTYWNRTSGYGCGLLQQGRNPARGCRGQSQSYYRLDTSKQINLAQCSCVSSCVSSDKLCKFTSWTHANLKESLVLGGSGFSAVSNLIHFTKLKWKLSYCPDLNLNNCQGMKTIKLSVLPDCLGCFALYLEVKG